MKALLLRCDYASLTNKDAAVKGLDLATELGRIIRANPAVVILVAVEPGDSARVSRATKALVRAVKRGNHESIIINLFAHLSASLASREECSIFEHDLTIGLKQALPNSNILCADFGYRKQIELNVREGQYDQVFVSS